MDTIFATELLLSIGSIGCLSWKIAGIPQLDGSSSPESAKQERRTETPAATPASPAPESKAPDYTRLRWALSSDHVPVRLGAVAELSVIPGAEALQLIASLVRDPDFEVRRIAVQRIAAERDPAYVDVLLQATRDVRIEVQNAACEGLIGTREPRVTDLFRRLSLQGLHYARILGIRGLGAIGGEEKLLLEIYRNSTGKIREETVVALSASREPAALDAVREYLKIRLENGPAHQRQEPVDEGHFRAVLEQEPAVAMIEEVETGFRDLPPSRRKGEVLARLGAIARDPADDERRRYLAVRGIGFLGGQPLLDQLEAHLLDPVTAVRFAATIAIGRLLTVRAMEPLKRSLGDASFLVRGAAVVFLDQMGNSVDRHVFEAASQDSDTLVRALARKALGTRPLPTPIAIPVAPVAPPAPLEKVASETKPEPAAPAPAPKAPPMMSLVPPQAPRTDKALEALLSPLRRTGMTRPPTGIRLRGDGRKLTLSEVLRRA